MLYFIFGYGCAAVADAGPISIPTTAYSSVSMSDMARYENPPLISFPTKAREEGGTHQTTLDAMRALEDGWDSYSAPAPRKEAIGRAKSLVAELNCAGYVVEHIGPSVLGGVGITVESAGTEYAIEFRNSGKVVVTEIGEYGEFTVHDFTGDSKPAHGVLSVLNKAPN